jgi:hypothetical protein
MNEIDVKTIVPADTFPKVATNHSPTACPLSETRNSAGQDAEN